MLAGAGAAAGANVRGTPGPDRLLGTPRADVIDGRGGDDFLHGGAGADVVRAGAGADRVAVQYDLARDSVGCGPGFDVVTADLLDAVAPDCETLSVRLARDTSTSFGAQHETQVEPDSYSAGRTIVTAFQSGRHDSGGAALIGWSTSTDAGATWRSGVLPALSTDGAAPGRYERVSDPVVAWDAAHRVWLVASLGLVEDEIALLISRSANGLAWSAPVLAAGTGESYDKEWLACDNGAVSPYRGRCYLAYLETVSGRISVRRSLDGGLTWSAPAAPDSIAALGRFVNGAFPVIRPDGRLVVAVTATSLFTAFGSDDIGAVASDDGGETFGPGAVLARVSGLEFNGVRAPLLVTADADADGTVYVAWADCRFRPDCVGSDIVLARSADGLAWEEPRRVPVGPLELDEDHFVPGLAVQPGTSGRSARVAVVYHSWPRQAGCVVEECPGIEAWLVVSRDGGRNWRARQRLTAEAMPLGWLASTGQGRMLGDYVSVSWSAGRPVPVFSLASRPSGGVLRQAITATTRLPAAMR